MANFEEFGFIPDTDTNILDKSIDFERKKIAAELDFIQDPESSIITEVDDTAELIQAGQALPREVPEFQPSPVQAAALQASNIAAFGAVPQVSGGLRVLEELGQRQPGISGALQAISGAPITGAISATKELFIRGPRDTREERPALKDLFLEEVRQTRELQEEVAEKAPGATNIGTALGIGAATLPALLSGGTSVAATLAPGFLRGTAISALRGLAGGAATGLATGTISSVEDIVAGDFTKAKQKVISDTAKGAAFGFGIGSLAKASSGLIQATGQKVKNIADAIATKTVSLSSAALNRLRPKQINQIGAALLDTDIIRLGPVGAQKLLTRTDDVLENVGKNIGKIIDDADKSGLAIIRSDGLKNELKQRIIKKLPEGTLPDETAIDRGLRELDGILDNFKPDQGLGFKDIQSIGRTLEGKIGEFTRAQSQTEQSKRAILSEASKSIRDMIRENIKQVAPDQFDEFVVNNSLFFNLSLARDSLETGVRQAFRKSGLSTLRPTGEKVGLAALDIARQPFARTLNAINKSVEQGKLGKFQRVLERASEQGPQAISRTIFVLSGKDPEFRKIIKDIEEEEAEE